MYGNNLVMTTGNNDVRIIFANVNDNVWRHFGVVFNPDGTALIYVNGVYNYTLVMPNGYLSVSNYGYIGKSGGNDPLLTGSIDDIRLYDGYLLAASTIQSIYANTHNI